MAASGCIWEMSARVYTSGAVAENLRSFQETNTDSQGRFSFEGLVAAPYRVHATPNRPFEKFAGFDAINPSETPEITIVVRQAAKLRGRVLDAQTEEPIKSYRVEYGEIHPMGHENIWEKRTINSESGAFELSARLDQDWYIRVAADGYAEMRLTGAALVSGGIVDDIEFRLSPSRIVRGFVADANGEPIGGAWVFHNEDVFDGMRGNNARYATAVADAEGRFVLGSLPSDAEFIYVKKTGYSVAQSLIDDEMNFVLTQGGAIEGRVQFGGAPPEGNVRVSTHTIVNGKVSSHGGALDENGFYRVQELIDGMYQFQVRLGEENGRHIETYYIEEQVEAFDGAVTTFDIWIPIGSAVLEGVISQDGVPVSQLPLRCTSGGYFNYAVTDETGYYRIDNLPEGPVQVDAHLPDERNPGATYYRNIIDTKLEPDAQARRDFDLSTPE